MRAHYEERWQRLDAGAEPPDAAARRAFLLERVAAGERVLDLGCGAGDFSAALAEAGALPVGVEIAEAALRRARERHPGLELALAPVEGPLPLGDASFDAVWASEVVEHVADTAGWLSEVRRVLRPGGRLLVTTPYHGRVRNLLLALAGFEAHFDPRGEHLRFYTRRSLRELLDDFGFVDVELGTLGGGPPLVRRTLRASARRGRW